MPRHDLDPVSLVAALCSAAGAGLYLLHDAGRISVDGRTAALLVAVAAAAIGVAWLVSSPRRRTVRVHPNDDDPGDGWLRRRALRKAARP